MGREERVMVYFNVISKRCHVGGKLLYRCQPPRYPTLICITIMVSPIEHSGRRPALCRDSKPLNRDAAISQPQKRLQINVTFLRALIWTPAMLLIPLTHTLSRSPGSEYNYRAFCFTIAVTSPFPIRRVNEYYQFLFLHAYVHFKLQARRYFICRFILMCYFIRA